MIVAVVSGLYFHKNIKINPPITRGVLSDSDEKLADAVKYFELIDDGEGYDDGLCQ